MAADLVGPVNRYLTLLERYQRLAFLLGSTSDLHNRVAEFLSVQICTITDIAVETASLYLATKARDCYSGAFGNDPYLKIMELHKKVQNRTSVYGYSVGDMRFARHELIELDICDGSLQFKRGFAAAYFMMYNTEPTLFH